MQGHCAPIGQRTHLANRTAIGTSSVWSSSSIHLTSATLSPKTRGASARLQAAPAGARPVDDGGLRGWRERSRNPVFEGGHLRGRRPQESRIAHKAATTRSVGKASTVRKASACKAGSRSDDTGHCEHRCKETFHGRMPCSILPFLVLPI